MVLNYVWLGLFGSAFIMGVIAMIGGDFTVFPDMMKALFDAAKLGFDISLALTGMMALWLGFMKIGEEAGVMRGFAWVVRPIMGHLFPGVPKGHPAHGAMTMNISANMLGLDNAATPLGLTAMNELQSLNKHPDTATNGQIMFMVLNTAGLTLIPTSTIAIRQALAVKQGVENFNAADIFLPTLIVTGSTLLVAVISVSLVQRIPLLKASLLAPVAFLVALFGTLSWWISGMPPDEAGRWMGLIGAAAILTIVMIFLVTGAWRRVNVYDAFVEGAKDGFKVAIMIIPYLVAMLCAIAVFRASGLMEIIMHGIGSVVAWFGLPTDFLPAVPVAMMKVLSGSGARGVMVDVMQNYGVDSFAGQLAAIIQGSTETTLYVLAVYFGSVGVKHVRHALPLALLADLVGLIVAVIVGYIFFK